MRATSERIEHLVMRMQGAFLETPWLALTLSAAQERFKVDEDTCEAVLAALVDANVLNRTPEGTFIRYRPRLIPGSVGVTALDARRQPGEPHATRRLARHAA